MKKLSESILNCKDGLRDRLINCFLSDKVQVVRIIQDFLPYAKVSLLSEDPFVIEIDMLDFEIQYIISVVNNQIKNLEVYEK